MTTHKAAEEGAVAAYLLIAVACAWGYLLIEFMVPGAFHFPGSVPSDYMSLGRTFYYFSASTLTTLGYGDVTPVHPYARSLAMMEAFIGQALPGHPFSSAGYFVRSYRTDK